jgi:hypothetical protein
VRSWSSSTPTAPRGRMWCVHPSAFRRSGRRLSCSAGYWLQGTSRRPSVVLTNRTVNWRRHRWIRSADCRERCRPLRRTGLPRSLLKNPRWQRGGDFFHKPGRNEGEGRDLRLGGNGALGNKARRPQGIPSPHHGAAALPTTERSGSGAGPSSSTGSWTQGSARASTKASNSPCRPCSYA